MKTSTSTRSKITEAHFQQVVTDGYTIIPDFYEGEELKEMAAAQRRVLKTWDQVKDNPPPTRISYTEFPSAELILTRAIVDPQVLAFARRFLKTEQIHYRAGYMISKYPGNKNDGAHIDNANNSLLPMSDSAPEYGQIGFWVHLEDVAADQGPLKLVSHRDGRDMAKARALVCKGGTACIFNNYTWHSASAYERENGQRFTWGFMFGRADCYWEGFRHYTDKGTDPNFIKLVVTLTAKEREIFRFPPVGHPYYTVQTLQALEKQYPGWNALGEYGQK